MASFLWPNSATAIGLSALSTDLDAADDSHTFVSGDTLEDLFLFVGGHAILYSCFRFFSFPFTERRDQSNRYFFLIYYLTLFLALTALAHMPKIRRFDLFKSFGIRDILYFAFVVTPFSCVAVLSGDWIFRAVVFARKVVWFAEKQKAGGVDTVLAGGTGNVGSGGAATSKTTAAGTAADYAQEPRTSRLAGVTTVQGVMARSTAQLIGGSYRASAAEVENCSGSSASGGSSGSRFSDTLSSLLSPSSTRLNEYAGPLTQAPIASLSSASLDSDASSVHNQVPQKVVQRSSVASGSSSSTLPGSKTGLSDALFGEEDVPGAGANGIGAEGTLHAGKRKSEKNYPTAESPTGAPPSRQSSHFSFQALAAYVSSPQGQAKLVQMKSSASYSAHRTGREFVSNSTLLTSTVALQYWLTLLTRDEEMNHGFVDVMFGPESIIVWLLAHPVGLLVLCVATFSMLLVVSIFVDWYFGGGKKYLLSYGPRWEKSHRFLDPATLKEMVPWYAMMSVLTALDISITGVFIGRFDVRQMLTALKGPPKIFSFYRNAFASEPADASVHGGGHGSIRERSGHGDNGYGSESVASYEASPADETFAAEQGAATAANTNKNASAGVSVGGSRSGRASPAQGRASLPFSGLTVPGVPLQRSSTRPDLPSPQSLGNLSSSCTPLSGPPAFASAEGNKSTAKRNPLEKRSGSAELNSETMDRRIGASSSTTKQRENNYASDVRAKTTVTPSAAPSNQSRPPGPHDEDDDTDGDLDDNPAATDVVWVDFVADTGDGFNAQYAIARAMAQPSLRVAIPSDLPKDRMMIAEGGGSGMADRKRFVTLPRSKYYFHGGDIAYPSPTREEFLERFFFPYHLAMREPFATSTGPSATSAATSRPQQAASDQQRTLNGTTTLLAKAAAASSGTTGTTASAADTLLEEQLNQPSSSRVVGAVVVQHTGGDMPTIQAGSRAAGDMIAALVNVNKSSGSCDNRLGETNLIARPEATADARAVTSAVVMPLGPRTSMESDNSSSGSAKNSPGLPERASSPAILRALQQERVVDEPACSRTTLEGGDAVPADHDEVPAAEDLDVPTAGDRNTTSNGMKMLETAAASRNLATMKAEVKAATRMLSTIFFEPTTKSEDSTASASSSASDSPRNINDDFSPSSLSPRSPRTLENHNQQSTSAGGVHLPGSKIEKLYQTPSGAYASRQMEANTNSAVDFAGTTPTAGSEIGQMMASAADAAVIAGRASESATTKRSTFLGKRRLSSVQVENLLQEQQIALPGVVTHSPTAPAATASTPATVFSFGQKASSVINSQDPENTSQQHVVEKHVSINTQTTRNRRRTIFTNYNNFLRNKNSKSDGRRKHVAGGSVNKTSPIQMPSEKLRASDLTHHAGPLCFLIPGNHDWYDNLDTFQDLICHRSWLGGWYMPQTHSYFIVQIQPHWYVFGLDISLTNDIDATQFLYFKTFVEQDLIPGKDRVIAITHMPNFSVDPYVREKTGPWLMQLLHGVCKDVLAMRWCGDLHHYMRFSPDHLSNMPVRDGLGNVLPNKNDAVPLIVAGGGGAFTHPTPWGGENLLTKDYEPYANEPKLPYGGYKPAAMYPSGKTTKMMAASIPFKWRTANHQADIVIGIAYLCAALGCFPCCFVNLNRLLNDDELSWSSGKNATSYLGLLRKFFFVLVPEVYLHIWQNTYLALAMQLVLLYAGITFADSQRFGRVCKHASGRALIGLCHAVAHSLCIVCFVLILEILLEHSQQYRKGIQTTPAVVEYLDPYLGGWLKVLLEFLMQAVELPHFLVGVKGQLCMSGEKYLNYNVSPTPFVSSFVPSTSTSMGASSATASATGSWTTTREAYLGYKFGMGLYFYLIAVPCAAFLMGFYFFITYTVFGIHAGEAFVSLRDPNHKSFLRCRIAKDGVLKAWAIGIENTGEDVGAAHWQLDSLARSKKENPWDDAMPSKYFSHKVSQPHLVDVFTVLPPGLGGGRKINAMTLK
mmetsp:Transcript_16463/g.40736  ORF Transcript_16463/g.40736 Transcript_16463/m.40736 type:complete len:1974 (-) Transcript_16463:461-6382(-)|eukprot:CAMPEP_0178988902 /NCGR_PEP_ID=MMETSP0795-20121207/4057_1 /TAXON_ID=88552 /ORGANISM="Amoebophrya sp., Strain Ameob2" /LENGTH=1973 /DNA_ID=CAMNT_0020680205 /DNA_START=409 /DNA_END=6330 /DNA_ORIENTATION=-